MIDTKKVEQVIEVIRPAIQADNGDIHLRGVDEEAGVVSVELVGACVSRPASTVTLKAGIERILKDRVPGVTEVVDVGDGWYEPELEHCWMAQTALFQIAGPVSAGQRLEIRAISRLDSSRLSATADGISLGTTMLGPAGDVAPEFPLPDPLIGRSAITVQLMIDRVYEVEGDPRKLGLAVSRIQLI